MVKDPVCEMEVDPERSGWVSEYDGREYYFCSGSCQRAFIKNPTKYIGLRPMGRSHVGHMGGCCGVGMGGGWRGYFYIAIMILLLMLLLFRR